MREAAAVIDRQAGTVGLVGRNNAGALDGYFRFLTKCRVPSLHLLIHRKSRNRLSLCAHPTLTTQTEKACTHIPSPCQNRNLGGPVVRRLGCIPVLGRRILLRKKSNIRAPRKFGGGEASAPSLRFVPLITCQLSPFLLRRRHPLALPTRRAWEHMQIGTPGHLQHDECRRFNTWGQRGSRVA